MQMFVATWTSMAMLRDKCNEVIIDMDEYPCDDMADSVCCVWDEPWPEECPFECTYEDECWAMGGEVLPEFECDWSEGVCCAFDEPWPEECPYDCTSSIWCWLFGGTAHDEYDCGGETCCEF